MDCYVRARTGNPPPSVGQNPFQVKAFGQNPLWLLDFRNKELPFSGKNVTDKSLSSQGPTPIYDKDVTQLYLFP